MRRVLLSICVLSLGAAPLAVAADAQATDPNTPVSAEAPEAPATTAEPVAQEPGAATAGGTAGLPERAAPARTLRAYWHVFVAFAITWLLLFGYALSVGRRFARLDDEVRRLEGTAK